ncbi:MAG TPA: hypothetical protein VNS50_01775, partial [Ginsengibacter sp.]|nr:hypothetical protein [Ginsengibacter sp.]
IKKVVIGSNTFFYNRRYVELVMENTVGRLLKSQMFDVVKREKIGAYDQPSSTSAIDSYGSFVANFGEVPVLDLKVRENITLVLKTEYFFGDQYNLLLPANKKNIYKAYHSKQDRIDKYLGENSVDFKNPDDLKKLMDYLAKG